MVDSTVLTVPVLASDPECDSAIARLGELSRALAGIEADKAKAVAVATAEAETKATPLQTEQASLEAAIAAWCAKERARLTEGGRTKTVEFKAGKVFWRMGRARVVIDEELTTVDKIVAKLKELRLKRMVRVKEVPNLQAILNEPVKVKGIRGLSIVEGTESFSIEPVTAELVDMPAAAAAAAA